LAGGQVQRRSADSYHSESGQSDLPGLVPHFWQRRLGTCLLPQIQQSPPRISPGLVERRELGRDQQAIRGLQGAPRARDGAL